MRLGPQPGASHSGVDVGDGLLRTEAAQGAAQSDPLFELAELRRFQLAVEFLLAGENDLQQFAAAVLQVAEQADLFEYVPFEVVRLIHDQHRGAPGGGALQQHVVEREQDLGLRQAVAAQIEIVGQQLEELLHREAGVEQGREGDLLRVEEIAQALEHGGLAGADLPGERDETLTALHPINQAGERFLVLRAPEQKRGVRAHVERVFGEAEEGVVHVHRSRPRTRTRL